MAQCSIDTWSVYLKLIPISEPEFNTIITVKKKGEEVRVVKITITSV